MTGFVDWYKSYPKKADKIEAEKLWDKLSHRKQELARLDTLDRTMRHSQWQDKKYVPSPARYLRKELWNDEIVTDKTRAEQQLEVEDGTVLSRFWTMLKQFYGSRFTNSFGEVLPAAWKYGLEGITEDEVSCILRYLATENTYHLPDLPRVVRIWRIGRQNWRTDQKQLTNPSKPETVKSELKKIKRKLRCGK